MNLYILDKIKSECVLNPYYVCLKLFERRGDPFLSIFKLLYEILSIVTKTKIDMISSVVLKNLFNVREVFLNIRR